MIPSLYDTMSEEMKIDTLTELKKTKNFLQCFCWGRCDFFAAPLGTLIAGTGLMLQ